MSDVNDHKTLRELDWQPSFDGIGWDAESFVGTYHVQDLTQEGEGWRLIATVSGELFVTNFSGHDAEKRAYDRAEELEVQACG